MKQSQQVSNDLRGELRQAYKNGQCVIDQKIIDLPNNIFNLRRHLDKSEYTVKFIYMPYDCDKVKDAHWGCAWRAIQMVLSAKINDLKALPSFEWLFSFFGKRSVLEDSYLAKHSLLYIPDFLKNAVYVPSESQKGWAEPYIGNIIFYFLGFSSDLLLINGYPTNANAPKEVFESTLDFKQFTSYMKNHFSQNGTPIMIDDSLYAMVIYGIRQDDDKLILYIGDPHIYSNREEQYQGVGTYSVTLDYEGNQLSHSIEPEVIEQYMYSQSYLGVHFKEKYWMVTTVKENEDVLTEWIVNDENHILI